MKFLLLPLLLAIQSAYSIPFEGSQLLPEDPLEGSSNQCPPILSQDHTVQSRAVCGAEIDCVTENDKGFMRNLFTNSAQCGTGQRCCYTDIACYGPYDGFCLNKSLGPPSQCASGKYVDDGCSHVQGASDVQCCLRVKDSLPRVESDSTPVPPVPAAQGIQFGQPIQDKSSLPTQNEQAAQGFNGPTNFEVATNAPELNQFLLPDALLAPADEFDNSYGLR